MLLVFEPRWNRSSGPIFSGDLLLRPPARARIVTPSVVTRAAAIPGTEYRLISFSSSPSYLFAAVELVSLATPHPPLAKVIVAAPRAAAAKRRRPMPPS